jgi:hypothetical protein
VAGRSGGPGEQAFFAWVEAWLAKHGSAHRLDVDEPPFGVAAASPLTTVVGDVDGTAAPVRHDPGLRLPAVQSEVAEQVHPSELTGTREIMNLSFQDIMLALIAAGIWVIFLFGMNTVG